jgi:hypothetical protein
MLRKSRITVSVGTVGAVVTINRKIVPQNLIDLSSQAEEEKTPPPSPSTHQNMSPNEPVPPPATVVKEVHLPKACNLL